MPFSRTCERPTELRVLWAGVVVQFIHGVTHILCPAQVKSCIQCLKDPRATARGLKIGSHYFLVLGGGSGRPGKKVNLVGAMTKNGPERANQSVRAIRFGQPSWPQGLCLLKKEASKLALELLWSMPFVWPLKPPRHPLNRLNTQD